MIRKLLLLLGVLLLAGGGYFYYSFESLLKRGLESGGTVVLGTAVTVDSVGVSPLSGRGNLRNLRIANPEGFDAPYAMELSALEVSVNTASVFSDVIEIDRIHIDSPSIVYEHRLVTDNFRALLENIERGGAGGAEGRQGASRQLIIREFAMINPQVTVGVASATVPVALPDIRLADIGDKDTAVTAAEAAGQIFAAISQSLLTADLSRFELFQDRAREQLDSTVDQVQDAVGQGLDSLRDALRGQQ